MPSKFNSTAKRPGKAVKKPYNRGGRTAADMAGRNTGGGRRGAALSQARLGAMATNRPSKRPPAGAIPLVSRNKGGRANLRDEEARVIGVQDDAADEMRRVKARRPKDAAERRDKKDQLARVGSRERNARDEMDRLRDEAGNMGMKRGGRSKADNSRTKMSHVAKKRDKNIGRTEAEIALPPAKNVRDEPPRNILKPVADTDTGMKRGGRSKKDAEKAQSKGTGNFDKYVRSRGWMREGNRPGSTSSGLKTGGKAVKKMAKGRQTTADKLDERLGNIDGRESTKSQSYGSRRNESNAMTRGAVPRSRATSPSTQRQGNMLINQHKRMAMGQDVLLAKGGKTPSTTAVNIDMGAPKTKTIKARGMGAAIKGGQFRENT